MERGAASKGGFDILKAKLKTFYNHLPANTTLTSIARFSLKPSSPSTTGCSSMAYLNII